MCIHVGRTKLESQGLEASGLVGLTGPIVRYRVALASVPEQENV